MNATRDQDRIFVAARLKPVEKKPKIGLKIERNRLFLVDAERDYEFDAIFGEEATQVEVFNGAAEKIVSGCLEGFNGTIFAYGQTGAGKTHTMYKPEHADGEHSEHSDRGIVPRAAQMLFDGLREKKEQYGETFTYEIKCSFVELYKEELADLFNPNRKPAVSDQTKSVELKDAELRSCDSVEEMMHFIKEGCSRRHVARTAMNEHRRVESKGSRSHSIFTIHLIVGKSEGDYVRKKRARLNLVDLAGSEKLADSKVEGDRRDETVKINKSLLQLGIVIRSFAKRGVTRHIPYRDSTLTHLLKDSLGGNSRTAFVVQLNPTRAHVGPTIKSADFAESLRLVKNHVHVNEDLECKDNSKMHALLQELEKDKAALQEEISKLKDERDAFSDQCDELRAENLGLRTVAPSPQAPMSQKNRRRTGIFNGRDGNVAPPAARPIVFAASNEAESSGNETEKLKKELDETKKRLDEAEKKLKETTKGFQKAKEKITTLLDENSRLLEQLADSERANDTHDISIAEFDAEKTAMKVEFKHQRDELALELAAVRQNFSQAADRCEELREQLVKANRRADEAQRELDSLMTSRNPNARIKYVNDLREKCHELEKQVAHYKRKLQEAEKSHPRPKLEDRSNLLVTKSEN